MSNELQRQRIEAGSKAPIQQSSPLNYIGGKWHIAEKLWTMRPDAANYTTFIDPFVGGASTPLAFNRLGIGANKKFLIRDTCKPTINFWDILQNSPLELAYAADDFCKDYVDGVDVHSACLAAINDWLASGNHPVKAAAGFYIHSHICIPQVQFDFSRKSFFEFKGNRWLKTARYIVGRLINWSEQIQGWDIKLQDFKDTIAEAVSLGDSAFLFLDPPYEATGKSDTADVLYDLCFGKSEHDLLANLVADAASFGVKSMITINDSAVNRQRYSGFHQLAREQITASNKLDSVTGTKVKKVIHELVILTYEPPFFKQAVANTNWKLAPSANDNQPLEISQGDCA